MPRSPRRISLFATLGVSLTANFLVCGTSFADSDVIPQTPPFSRYEKMLRQSPFAPVTQVVQETAPDQPNFAASMFVEGVYSVGGKFTATIQDRDSGERRMLKAGQTSADGLALVNVEWSPIVAQSKVTIRKGSDFATIGFDQATAIEALVPQPMDAAAGLNSPAQFRPSQPQVNRPGQPNPQVSRRVVQPQSANNPNVIKRPRIIPQPPSNSATPRRVLPAP